MGRYYARMKVRAKPQKFHPICYSCDLRVADGDWWEHPLYGEVWICKECQPYELDRTEQVIMRVMASRGWSFEEA